MWKIIKNSRFSERTFREQRDFTTTTLKIPRCSASRTVPCLKLSQIIGQFDCLTCLLQNEPGRCWVGHSLRPDGLDFKTQRVRALFWELLPHKTPPSAESAPLPWTGTRLELSQPGPDTSLPYLAPLSWNTKAFPSCLQILSQEVDFIKSPGGKKKNLTLTAFPEPYDGAGHKAGNTLTKPNRAQPADRGATEMNEKEVCYHDGHKNGPPGINMDWGRRGCS